jgi:sugar/nucleoside kinase (ribokinase family)
LTDEGVDVSYAENIEGARTQIAFILIDEASGERTVIWHRDPKLAYGKNTIPPIEAATLGRILHITPHDTKVCIGLATAARSAGVIVSADMDRRFDGIETLLPLVDVCIGSSEFLTTLLQIDDPAIGLRELRVRYGCPIAGVTLGEKGSIFLCGDELIKTPGFAVPGGCVDTTGAGDAFRTGFIFGMLNGESVDQSIRSANAVAALKCRGDGARSALPTRQELALFLNKTRQ